MSGQFGVTMRKRNQKLDEITVGWKIDIKMKTKMQLEILDSCIY